MINPLNIDKSNRSTRNFSFFNPINNFNRSFVKSNNDTFNTNAKLSARNSMKHVMPKIFLNSTKESKLQLSNPTESFSSTEEWQTQFFKTKFCPYQIEGCCANGTFCRFAHNNDEVRPLPNLKCTKLCDSYLRGEVCKSSNCSFAHSPSQLRISNSSFYKVTVCNFYKKGRCWNGAHCRFAHGITELQKNNTILLPTDTNKDVLPSVKLSNSTNEPFLQSDDFSVLNLNGSKDTFQENLPSNSLYFFNSNDFRSSLEEPSYSKQWPDETKDHFRSDIQMFSNSTAKAFRDHSKILNPSQSHSQSISEKNFPDNNSIIDSTKNTFSDKNDFSLLKTSPTFDIFLNSSNPSLNLSNNNNTSYDYSTILNKYPASDSNSLLSNNKTFDSSCNNSMYIMNFFDDLNERCSNKMNSNLPTCSQKKNPNLLETTNMSFFNSHDSLIPLNTHVESMPSSNKYIASSVNNKNNVPFNTINPFFESADYDCVMTNNKLLCSRIPPNISNLSTSLELVNSSRDSKLSLNNQNKDKTEVMNFIQSTDSFNAHLEQTTKVDFPVITQNIKSVPLNHSTQSTHNIDKHLDIPYTQYFDHLKSEFPQKTTNLGEIDSSDSVYPTIWKCTYCDT